jgi:gas vesicle protein
MFGPVGTGFGAIVGALAGFMGGDKKAALKKIQTMTPEQLNQLKQDLQMLSSEGQLGQGFEQSLSNLRELMDPSSEAQQRFADPYMKQFEQQTLPGLAETFAGKGATGGALSSSGFGQAVGGAGANLQSYLAQLKNDLMRSAGQDLMSQYQTTANRSMSAQPFGYQPQSAQQGSGTSALQGWAQGGFQGGKEMTSGLSNMWSNYGPIIGGV